MKKTKSNIALILIFIIGLSLILYPSLSDYWNSIYQSKAIINYTEQVADLNQGDYQRLLEEARDYNAQLAEQTWTFALSDAEKEIYKKMLNLGDGTPMAWIEIPVIDVSLPIYHSTDDEVLQVAVGHIEGTSLPVGGNNTHCVLSGHRGLPSAKLLSNLDRMVEGDIFTIQTLDETLTYEVDQIRIVLPEDVDDINLVKGKDYCTLVTCTPYGINSHRLLVRGQRIENQDLFDSIRVPADAFQIEPVIVAPFVAVPILLLLFAWLLIHYRKRK